MYVFGFSMNFKSLPIYFDLLFYFMVPFIDYWFLILVKLNFLISFVFFMSCLRNPLVLKTYTNIYWYFLLKVKKFAFAIKSLIFFNFNFYLLEKEDEQGGG